ncbi:hypothetical protein LCGC14_0336780 [marine sediment metagenome]|uniref:Uncharacterized protein n=1 Tax=marine sediment metagenome TaxID=412755 RepID=A0A0F9WMJ4_9ZZZZ
MAKKENALATIDEAQYPALTSGRNINAVMKVNFGGDDVKPEDLITIKLPTGGSITWLIPTTEGETSTLVLEGILVHIAMRRAYWKEGNEGFPDCRAIDARIGVGDPGGDCSACPNAVFGTKINKDGSKSGGQACNLRRLLFMVREGDLLPIVIDTPATSLVPVKNWLIAITSRGLFYYQFLTRLELTAAGSGQEKYAIVKPSCGPLLSPEATEKILNYAKTLQEVFSAVEVSVQDGQREENFTPQEM